MKIHRRRLEPQYILSKNTVEGLATNHYIKIYVVINKHLFSTNKQSEYTATKKQRCWYHQRELISNYQILNFPSIFVLFVPMGP